MPWSIWSSIRLSKKKRNPARTLRSLKSSSDAISEIGENIIVILSTHIVEDVSNLCRNMAIIHKGEVLLTGNPRQQIEAARGI